MGYAIHLDVDTHLDACTLELLCRDQTKGEQEAALEAGLVSVSFLNKTKAIMGKSKFFIRLEVFKQLQNEHQKGMEIRAGCRGCEYPFLC